MRLTFVFASILVLALGLSAFTAQAQSIDFPKSNFYARTTPGALFCDEKGGLTIEVTIANRPDVARVFISDSSGGITVQDDNAPAIGYGEMFDNGEDGDVTAGDRVFTRSGMTPPCTTNQWGYGTINYYLRVELRNGTFANSWYPINVGVVAAQYRGVFEVKDLGDGLSATAYAFFIEDPNGEVLDGYPLSELVCGVSNFNAYRKLYSVFSDDFDIAMVTPGLQLWRRIGHDENIPYLVRVSNDIQNIGLPIFNNAQAFGSGGRLRAAIYNSFGGLDVMDHELGHVWGMDIGRSLGLVDRSEIQHGIGLEGHWYENTDIGGQMSLFYFINDYEYGLVQFNAQRESWTFADGVSAQENQPYSPLELYVMGLIPPEEVPPIHIFTDLIIRPFAVQLESYETVTIEDIMAAEGGEREPSFENSQKDFSLAYIVTQDIPYNEAGYAYASLMSYHLTSKNPPDSQTLRFYMPFYWATGGRATLETRLPVDLPDPVGLPGQAQATATPEPEPTEAGTLAAPTLVPTSPPESEEAAVPGGCNLLPVGLVLLPGLLRTKRKKQQP